MCDYIVDGDEIIYVDEEEVVEENEYIVEDAGDDNKVLNESINNNNNNSIVDDANVCDTSDGGDSAIRSVVDKINRSVERSKRNPRSFQLVENPSEERYSTGKSTQGQRTKRKYTKRKGVNIASTETVVTEKEILEKLKDEKDRLDVSVNQQQSLVLCDDSDGIFEEVVEDDPIDIPTSLNIIKEEVVVVGAPPQIPASSIEDLQSLKSQENLEQMQEKMIASSSQQSQSSSSSSSSGLLSELGPGYTVKLSLGQSMTLKEHLEYAERLQRENIAKMSHPGENRVMGLMSKSIQQNSSSSSSSSSSRGNSFGVPKLPEVNLLPVGSAPLEDFLNYIETEIAAIEATIPRSVFEKAKTIGTPHACPRYHVKRVLMAPHGNYRPCLNKEMCVCRHDFGFIMMEYLDPNTYENKTWSSSGDPNFCYLCLLMMVDQDYTNKDNGQGSVATVPLPFYHIAGVPGEYKTDAMLSSGAGYSELDLATLACETTRANSENTHGLTRPVRAYATNDYTRGIRKVMVNGNLIEVNYLEESQELFFLTHDATYNALRSVKSFNYIKTKITFKPDTIFILAQLFAPESQAYVVGYRRLGDSKKSGKTAFIRPYPGSVVTTLMSYLDDKYHHYPLPRYWCIVDSVDIAKFLPNDLPPFERERFPWEFIFTNDVRVTARNLEAVVRGGRINLAHLFKQTEKDLAVTTNLAIPLSHYENMLKHPAMASRRIYVALKVRLAVLYTIKKIYPLSSHSKIDDKVHHRVELLIAWHEKNHCMIITKDTFDNDLSTDALDKLVNIPPFYHYYDTDMHYFKYENTIKRRETPMEVLAECYPQYRFFFCEFKEMLAVVDREFILEGHVRDLLKDVDVSVHFKIAVEVIEKIDPYYFIKQDPDALFQDKQDLVTTLLQNADFSIYITLLYRVNLALHLHESSIDQVEKMKKDISDLEKKLFSKTPLSEEERKTIIEEHHTASWNLKNLRWIRYNLRLFVYTHLDLTQRMYDLNIFSNEHFKMRVPRKNTNYILTHYDETYPFPSRTPHEGAFPDLSKIINCVPFPDPSNIGARNVDTLGHDLFKMLNALFPRFHQSRPPINFREQFTAYRTLTVRAIEMCLLGAYQHADYMPRFESCVGIHRQYRSHFTVDQFAMWQSQRGTISILAMREFLTFMVKLRPAYDAYITRNFPFWVDFSKKVYAAADFMRKMYRRENSLGVIQHAIFIMFKPGADRSILPPHFIQVIEEENLFQEIRFNLVRKPMQVDELRSFCLKLTTINKERAKEGVPRPGLTESMKNVIEKRVRLIPPGSRIELKWLEEFNFKHVEPSEHVVVTKFTIELLSLAFYFIMHGERGDWLAEKAIRSIPLRDYEIIDAFFFNLHIQYCVTVYELDEDCKRAQWQAICRRYNITPELEKYVCASVMSLTYAPCCGMVKSYVSQDCKDPSFGSKELGVDIYSGDVTDRQNTGARLDKKAYRVNTLFQNKIMESLSRNDQRALMNICERIDKLVPKKHQTRFYSQHECGTIPVIMISALGQVVQVKNARISKTNISNPAVNSFTICTICASISTFSTRMFGVNGFDCNHCDYYYTQQYWVPECVHCYKKIIIGEKNYCKLVFDDRPGIGDFKLKRMYVCRHCRKCGTTGYKSHGEFIYTATELKKFKMFQNNGAIRFVLMRTGQNLVDYFQSVKQPNVRSIQKQKKSERKIRFE